ncbi:S24 family peptidase [Sphingomonas sp.]|uniref:S24 family peptidase n=1 Tax=Sphingomonas sp. TaxID=28214 RepID=UPI001E03900D|nr:S24 family peptidase [Sphingomonas sp.]MBX9796910.1 hypothetical protein [Sphingomonas sp.]
MTSSDPRAALAALAVARGESLAALSRLIGRNAAYLQQYVQRGSPRMLAEGDRRLLAAYLGVAEAALGGPDGGAALVRVPRIDVVASAGPGGLAEEDRASGGEAFDPVLLRRLGVRAGALSIVTARGDSMLPTIADGDELLIDTDDRRGEGVFVARHGGALVVKRVARPGGAAQLLSDNTAYPPLDLREAEIVGRVVRLTRRLK